MTIDDTKKVTALISYNCWVELQDIKNRSKKNLQAVIAEILEEYTNKRQMKKTS